MNQLFESLYNEFSKLNNQQYANLLLKMFLELNLNIQPLWSKLEELILNNIHHLSLGDICKINFVATLFCPKFSTVNFRQQLKEEVKKNNINNYNTTNLIDILIGFKHSKDYDFYFEILELVKNNFENWANEVKKTNKNKNKENISTPQGLVANLFYAVSYGKPSKYKKHENIDRIDNFYEDYIELIDVVLEYIPKMNLNEIKLVLNAVALSE